MRTSPKRELVELRRSVRALQVPSGDEVILDCNYLLDRGGWLHLDASFARFARGLWGGALMVALGFCGWLCRRMMTSRPARAA